MKKEKIERAFVFMAISIPFMIYGVMFANPESILKTLPLLIFFCSASYIWAKIN